METQSVTRPRRLSRAERRAQTREELLEAAARVFARKGYAGASVDDIAEEAGFTVGALYSNFEGKQDLFLAALERKVRAIVADTLQREAARSGHPLQAPPDEVAAAVLALWRGLMQQRLLDPAAVSATTFATTVSWMLQGVAAAHRQ